MRLALSKIIVISKWFEDFNSRAAILPIKARWNLARNMKQINSFAQEYSNFRNSLSGDIQEKFFTDDKSDELDKLQTDENGKPILDENGEQIVEKVRKIKPEYLLEFQDEMNSINSQLTNILIEEREITLYPINLDDFIDKLPDDADLTMEDLEMLATFTEINREAIL